jgi:hypothetical protein
MRWTLPDLLGLPESYYDTLIEMLQEEERDSHRVNSHVRR